MKMCNKNPFGNSFRRNLIAHYRSFCSCLVTIFLWGTGAEAQMIDINGGASWGGWERLSDSQAAGVWVRGQTDRTFRIYRANFTLEQNQAISGSRLPDGFDGDGSSYTGDDGDSLFSGSWRANDRIVGVGIQYTGDTRGTTAFMHVDISGDDILPAQSFGASDGKFGHSAGDTSTYITSMPWNPRRFQTLQYSIWYAFSQSGSPEENHYIFPYGQKPTVQHPTRSFAILEPGSASRATSLQMFINLDAVARSNGGATFGDGNFHFAGTRIGFHEGDQTISESSYSQQIFPIRGSDTVIEDCQKVQGTADSIKLPCTRDDEKPSVTGVSLKLFDRNDSKGGVRRREQLARVRGDVIGEGEGPVNFSLQLDSFRCPDQAEVEMLEGRATFTARISKFTGAVRAVFQDGISQRISLSKTQNAREASSTRRYKNLPRLCRSVIRSVRALR